MAELTAVSAPGADRTVQARQRYISQIEDRYVLPDKGAVWQYLFAHPELAPILLQAYHQVQEVAPGARIELRVVQEPEQPDWSQLHAVVYTPLPTGQALDLLAQLDDAWFETQPNWVDDLFAFDVECA